MVDDVANVGKLVSVGYRSIDADDQEGDVVLPAVYSPNNDYMSDRLVDIVNYGEIYLVVDNTDSSTRRNINVVGGTISDRVASFELRSENEAITVEDIKLTR